MLDGVVTKLDELSHVIRTNRTTATLSCASRGMDVNLEFAEPFYGIVYADFDRHSACNFVGRGELTASYQLPLSGCGTLQDPLRVFTNNLIVRFHPSLEMDGDEVKTIVCRYPEPIVPPPLGPPLPVCVDLHVSLCTRPLGGTSKGPARSYVELDARTALQSIFNLNRLIRSSFRSIIFFLGGGSLLKASLIQYP